MVRTTTNSKTIKASANTIYKALTNPSALEVWQAPGNMTAKVHNFDLKVWGGYEMSLFYPDSAKTMQGKTQGKKDRFTARFVELIPNRKIVEAVNFQSPNPDFSGDMIVEITLESVESGTRVTYFFYNIPKEYDLKTTKQEQFHHLKNYPITLKAMNKNRQRTANNGWR